MKPHPNNDIAERIGDESLLYGLRDFDSRKEKFL